MNTLITSARRALPSVLAPSRVATLVLVASAAGCSVPTSEDVDSTSGAYTTRTSPDSNIASFKALDANTVYALDTGGHLFRDTISPASHMQVDANVKAFQPMPGGAFVYVLGSDGNLWFEPNAISGRTFVASGVTSFQALSIGKVLRKDASNNLWLQSGTAPASWVDGNVNAFHAIDQTAIYVLGNDAKLWNENGSMSNRFMVDQNVAQFFPSDWTHVYVEGSDATLWNESGTAGNRSQVDANVSSFFPVDNGTVYVKGSDSRLWREVQSYQFRDAVDGNVKSFQPAGATAAWVLGGDGKLWLEQMPVAPMVFSASTSSSNAQVGIWPNGSSIYVGTTSSGYAYPVDYSVGFAVTASTGQAFTFVAQGSLGANWPSQHDYSSWYLTGSNPELATYFSAIQRGNQSTMAVEDSLDLPGLWNELKQGVSDAQQVWAVIGPAITAVVGG